MGMVFQLAPLSDETIERLLVDPVLVWRVVAPDEPEHYERARSDAAGRGKPGLLSRLFGATPAAPAPFVEPAPLVLKDGEGGMADLDKAWHGIHYLLTGTDWGGEPPLDFIVAGGRDVGDEDVGYGTARVFTSAETRRIAASLDTLRDEELRSRFAPSDMMAKKIYPEIWDRDPEDDDTLGYLIEYVGTLRRTLASAASEGYGLLVLLS
jgi:hypothetical protein